MGATGTASGMGASRLALVSAFRSACRAEFTAIRWSQVEKRAPPGTWEEPGGPGPNPPGLNPGKVVLAGHPPDHGEDPWRISLVEGPNGRATPFTGLSNDLGFGHSSPFLGPPLRSGRVPPGLPDVRRILSGFTGSSDSRIPGGG